MAGSKKGERRGGAKPGHIRKSAAPAAPKSPTVEAKRRPGRPLGSPNKPKVDPELVKLLNRRNITPEQRGRLVDMYRTITGRSVRLPREVLLDAMRYFENSAIEYAEVLRANLEAAAAAKSPEAQAVLGAAVADAEAQVDKYVAMSADIAFKAAPYFHARLAAFVSTPGTEQSNQTLLQLLMRDLDEAGKPARFIEHDASEVAGTK